MEIAVLILLVLIFILLLYIIFGGKNERINEIRMIEKINQLERSLDKALYTNNERVTKQLNSDLIKLSERMGVLEKNNANSLFTFSNQLQKALTENFKQLSQQTEKRLIHINDQVNSRLNDGFDKTNKTFTNILERLSKIDEAQKKIESLSTEIVSLQDILTDKKARGAYGEIQLHHLLSSVFGEKNDKVYRLQHQFSNGLRSDAVLFAPKPLGTIAIDSKFPLENYRRMIDRTLDQKTQEHYSKLFQMDLKKHIDDISSKYIIYGETSDQAIMFLPAEAIYAEINAYYPQVVDYANRKRVWIVSPTTFMATLTTMQVILKNIERDQYAHVIQTELGKLSLEFNRYKERWDKLSKHIKTVSKDVDDIHITTEKINKRFEQINQVEELLE